MTEKKSWVKETEGLTDAQVKEKIDKINREKTIAMLKDNIQFHIEHKFNAPFREPINQNFRLSIYDLEKYGREIIDYLIEKLAEKLNDLGELNL